MTLWESCIFSEHKYIYFIIKGNFVEILWFARVPGLGALRRFSGLGGRGVGAGGSVKNVGRKWACRETELIELLAAQLTPSSELQIAAD